MSTYNWRKSSYIGNAGNCVNVAADRDGTVRIRESDTPDVKLAASSATFGPSYAPSRQTPSAARRRLSQQAPGHPTP
ncbi:DUF397 domain-containing protein [Streptomyces sp. FXJ1.4098]|nr:DUF397 domain-containing protein [Streptomyces sp. FXJ1.4098]